MGLVLPTEDGLVATYVLLQRFSVHLQRPYIT